jgi:hypothetical protein
LAIESILLEGLKSVRYANGAFLIVACAALAVLLQPRLRPFLAALPAVPAPPAAFALLCGLALGYAFYPNFIDHGEPMMAGIGMVLLEGRPLYPPLDAYSFHGCLYGPLMAEVQAMAIYLGAELGGLPVLLASKLAGVAALFAACAFFFRLAPGWGFARSYYVLFLLPFVLIVFWNRGDPLLLLFTTASLAIALSERLPRLAALLLVGACAGLASGAKMHGAIYILPAAAMLLWRRKFSVWEFLVFGAAADLSFFLLFLPDSVSLRGFLSYFGFGAGHGLSAQLFLENIAFLCALWSPLLMLPGGWRQLRERPLLALAALQLFIAVVGSKPGAGIHHLLPFIPVNALVFAPRIEKAGAGAALALRLYWIAVLLPGLAAALLFTLPVGRDWRTYARAGQELAQIQARHPDVVMGAGGNHFYPYTFMRPALELKGPPQVEFNSYMDLQLVGIADTPLRRAFEDCSIRHLAVPRREAPFSMDTFFQVGKPLFSDALRETFARRYVKIAEGTWFDTYECRPAP